MYRANVKANLMVKNITQIKSEITINFSVSAKIQENIMHAKKMYIWVLAACTCENGKYLRGIIDNSVITCD